MDPGSVAVFGTLAFNVVVTSVIIMGWLIIRQCRGDKQQPPKKSTQQRISTFGNEGYRLSTLGAGQ